MGPTAPQIAIIRRTWAEASALGPLAGELFYGRLFQIAPETRPLFRGDMAVQGRKLVETLGFVVDHLDAEERFVPAAEDLARRHVGYGVKAGHYAAVGEALVWMLEHALGPRFGAQERAAWEAAYARLSSTMIRAAEKFAVEVPPDGGGGS